MTHHVTLETERNDQCEGLKIANVRNYGSIILEFLLSFNRWMQVDGMNI